MGTKIWTEIKKKIVLVKQVTTITRTKIKTKRNKNIGVHGMYLLDGLATE
jgi:hypothetical protein